MWRFLEDPMWTWLFSKQIWERISTQCPLYHKCRGPPKSAPPLPAVVSKDWAHTSAGHACRRSPFFYAYSQSALMLSELQNKRHKVWLLILFSNGQFEMTPTCPRNDIRNLWHWGLLITLYFKWPTVTKQNKTRQNRTDLLQAEANG